jgi:hypothetical protein
VNSPINTSASEKRAIRGVYDRVYIESGDVRNERMYSDSHKEFLVSRSE